MFFEVHSVSEVSSVQVFLGRLHTCLAHQTGFVEFVGLDQALARPERLRGCGTQITPELRIKYIDFNGQQQVFKCVEFDLIVFRKDIAMQPLHEKKSGVGPFPQSLP